MKDSLATILADLEVCELSAREENAVESIKENLTPTERQIIAIRRIWLRHFPGTEPPWDDGMDKRSMVKGRPEPAAAQASSDILPPEEMRAALKNLRESLRK